MKTKFELNPLIGILSLLVFCVLAAVSVTGTLVRCIVFAPIYILLLVAVYKVLDYFLGKYVSKSRDFWYILLPFAVLAVVARFVLGWDVLLAFFAAGMLAVAVDSVGKMITRKVPFSDIVKVVCAVFGSVVLYTAVSVIGGIYI